MILIIRGHIRDSFRNKRLYNLIKEINEIYHIEIFIHTWNIYSSNLSWRKINTDLTEVTRDIIYEYFYDLSFLIKHIIIDNDKLIEVKGKKEGLISKSKCPVLGWKFMWYGKFRIIDHIKNMNYDNNTIVINMRFDILTNSYSSEFNQIFNFICNDIQIEYEKNIFIKKKFVPGIDNIYIGNLHTMHMLISHFHNNLDEFHRKQRNESVYQEELVFRENNKLFRIDK
jgi:hypothetical protein